MLKHLLLSLLALCGAVMAEPAAAQSSGGTGLARLAPVAPTASCASLAALDLTGATGARTTLAAHEVAGPKAYCEVTGTIARDIHFEVRLPLAGWTQRFLQTGCGGLCGMLSIHLDRDEGCAPVTDGTIALASDDMGHHGMGGAWGENADQRIDFAYRGNHVTALAAKALIKAFYGQVPRFSYFSGCSDGGREALIAAQRYPADYDGIAAGAPALNFTVQNSFHHGWLAKANTGPDGKAILTAADMPLLHDAVLKACDGLDGLADGQITDPRACHLDADTIACGNRHPEPGKCFTDVQVAAVGAIYDGARSDTGKRLEVGPLVPGSELEWIGVFVPRDADGQIGSTGMALGTVNHLLFTPNPDYTVPTFPFTNAMFRREEDARKLYNADNPDLAPFAVHGGKLILYHGWSDPHISPLNTIDYYDRVGRALSADKRATFVRMFLMPGMGHCGGGDGPSEFPLLVSLMAWVEGGSAPDMMLAHRPPPPAGLAPSASAPAGPRPGAVKGLGDGGPPPEMLREMQRKQAELAKLGPRERPVYAYPRVAQYNGSGSPDVVTSFHPVTPAATSGISDWIGSMP